ncbi:chitotriosidase-1, partial [Lingula anatina]|uniref:Acidic mammalian chitinase n=1 Tax=Lingula anatina TaxID=7574 RepID=A0A1S3KG33_LINAN
LSSSSKKLVVYFTNWAHLRKDEARFVPGDIDPSLCTHIIYSFAKVNKNESGFILEGTQWSDMEMFSELVSIKDKYPNLKLLLAVGGWNHGTAMFNEMASSAATRAQFIKSTIKYLRDIKFDGFDYDWEYPGNSDRGSPPETKRHFAELIQDTRSAFEEEAKTSGKPRLLLTAAVAAGVYAVDSGYDVLTIAKSVDFINLMAYDFHGSWEDTTGHHSALYHRQDEPPAHKTANQDAAVNYWIQQGMPPDKIVLGVAFYGRTFTLRNPEVHGLGAPIRGPGTPGPYTLEPSMLAYFEICELQSAQRNWSCQHKVPYSICGNQWIGYDDTESLRMKGEYARSKGLGGVMVWSIDMDDFKGKFGTMGPYPLLRALKSGLDGRGSLDARPSDTQVAPTAPKPADVPGKPSSPSVSNSAQVPPKPSQSKAEDVHDKSETGVMSYPGDGLFPDPKDPTKYYSCANGIMYSQQCPPGLVFNPVTKTCDWPQNVRK